MHRGHDHDDHHGGGGGAAAAGHNRTDAPLQWQVLHGEAPPGGGAAAQATADLDLVEAAFVEGFMAASDPTSFLRLARVPFRATAADGAALVLLRTEIEQVADVGAVSPHLGGATFRYDPLPRSMVSRRRRLRFVYFDGRGPRPLSLGEVLALDPE